MKTLTTTAANLTAAINLLTAVNCTNLAEATDVLAALRLSDESAANLTQLLTQLENMGTQFYRLTQTADGEMLQVSFLFRPELDSLITMVADSVRFESVASYGAGKFICSYRALKA